DKEIRVFDQTDRELLPDEELERFCCGDLNGASYKEQFESRAKVYALSPGKAVHIPVFAPHWARNSNNVSISLSINFGLPEADQEASVYRFNRYLRRAGIKPQPPGVSPLRDSAKRVALKGLNAARRVRG
ncbi:MAG: hypothetical protein QOD99_1174, partial [Chthoniobacter sp.]|nr:hypothetical protein [Chthoniobacter sp.]